MKRAMTYKYQSPCSYFLFVFSLILLGLASPTSSATFISNDIFESPRVSVGRTLLQAAKSCPVDFQNMNYTIITSKCKGPNYPPKICCDAFKEFACPYADAISDLKNDCATIMFSYINIYGKYPPGLFAAQCKEGKEGLSCEAINAAKAPAPSKSSSVQITAATVTQLLVTAAFLLLLSFHFF